jgi:putative transposase
MRTAYRCRAYPSEQQQVLLNRTFGCVRVVWNRTLAARQAQYAAERKSVSYAETDRALTAMKRDPGLAWLGEVSCVPLQQALRHQHAAFGAFFTKRARYPRFKSRRGRQAATFTRSAFRLKGTDLWLAKMSDPLTVTWTWPGTSLADLNPTSVTVARDPAGRWFVTFHAEVRDPEPLPVTGDAVGIDLGLTDFAVLSGGQRIPHPRHMDRREQRLKRWQRRLARCQKGSANRAKARRKVARAHARVTDTRREFLHKASTDLIRRYDTIAVEDLAVSNMIRNRSLARAISRTGWGEFRRMLEYKAQRYGRTLVVAGRWFPSSKTCSACGFLLADLDLGTRRWACPGCGARHDRDINAARNILAAGLAAAARSGGDACGADVRHGQEPPPVQTAVNQEPRPARAGIPAPQGEE